MVREELIGLHARVTASTDPGRVGAEGPVMDETRETFTIRTTAGDRMVPKRGSTFTFTTAGGPAEIEGGALAFRPEDRIKKARLRA